MAGIDPLAAYGAFVSTAVAAWSVSESLRQRRRRLRVTCGIGTVYVPTGIVQPNYQPAGRHVSFKAQNDGPLVVRVVSCGLAKTRRRWLRREVVARMQLMIPENVHFPQDVEPGRSLDAVAKLTTFIGTAAADDFIEYDRPYFADALGRTYLGALDRGFLEEIRTACGDRDRPGDVSER